MSSGLEPNPGKIRLREYAGGKALRHFVVGPARGKAHGSEAKVLLRIVTFGVQTSGKKDKYRIKNQYFLEA